MVMCEANSQELRNYKLTAGLTNYPAAYCTGLLLARRLLTQFNMDTMYAAVEEVNGEKNWNP
jgi:large subunit ribosomal protein L5e